MLVVLVLVAFLLVEVVVEVTRFASVNACLLLIVTVTVVVVAGYFEEQKLCAGGYADRGARAE